MRARVLAACIHADTALNEGIQGHDILSSPGQLGSYSSEWVCLLRPGPPVSQVWSSMRIQQCAEASFEPKGGVSWWLKSEMVVARTKK